MIKDQVSYQNRIDSYIMVAIVNGTSIAHFNDYGSSVP